MVGYVIPITSSHTALQLQTCRADHIPGSSSLPVPPSDDCLEFIALAIGTQEYSCTNSGGMTTPTHTGATATLYNVAPLVPFLPAEDYLHNLPAYFLHYNYGELKNSSLSVLGHHYYVDGVPTFDLGDSGLFQLEIYATIEAPQNPSENIGWVYGKSLDGTWTVYRVETAGGNSPPSCQETPFSVPYSAEYWLYKSG